MPRLSLYKPEKGPDYRFIDRQISEMFQIGGTDLHLHKYIGVNTDEANATADQPHYATTDITNIQDLLLLENRDRKYDSSIYKIRGHYNVTNTDFNLSQFGLFLDNENLYMTVHINDFIASIGRKPISGDVLELPHLKDDFALNNFDVSLPRYYVVSDVHRASEGYSQTWWPHLYKLKLDKITNSQQFADILTKPTDQDANYAGDYSETTTYTTGQIIRYEGKLYTVTATTTGNTPPNVSYFNLYSGNTLESILSTRAISLQINDSILAQAEADAPKSGYETRQFYTLQVDDQGNPELITADANSAFPDASSTTLDSSAIHQTPEREGYSGYLLGDGVAPNGINFGHGITFPVAAVTGDYFLRTDFFPNRLFRYDGGRWIKREDAVRHTLSNTDTRSTFRTGFINNTTVNQIGDSAVEERQSLSKALKPKADL